MSYTVTKTVEFDAGHRVPYHDSRCRHPHGHRYRIEATVSGDLDDTGTAEHGMVIDFGHVKRFLTRIVEGWDHAMLVWVEDVELLRVLSGHGWRVVVLNLVPTAENLAAEAYAQLETLIGRWSDRLTLDQVTVWETPTSTATYRP